MPGRLVFGLFLSTFAVAAPLSPAAHARVGQMAEAGLAISGTVMVPGTREPVPRARVQISTSGPGAGQTIVTTDAGGRFSLRGLGARLYRVSPILPGTDPPEVSSLRTRRIRLAPGAPPPDLELWLPQRARVSGLITGPEGEPLPGFFVSLWRLGWNGRPTLVGVADSARVRSDETGRYELEAPPGEYYVDVTDASASSYQRHYYPGVLYPGEAVPITLHAGVDLTGIDVSIRDADLYTVRFSLTVPHLPGVSESISGYLPDDVDPIGALLYPLGSGRLDMGRLAYGLPLRRIDEDVWVIEQKLGAGDFGLSLVYSDALYAAFQDRGFDPEGLHWFAWTHFSVDPDDADETGIVDVGRIPVNPRVSVEGRVVVRAAEPDRVDLTGLHLTHLPEVSPDGAFLLEHLMPGPHAHALSVVSGLPEGWYVTSIRSGGHDILLDGLEVGPGTGPVEIVIAEGAAQIQGAVRNAEGQLMPDARVVLIPPPHRRGPQARFPTVVANTAGVYVFDRIPPGEYRLTAVDEAGTAATQNTSPDLYWESPEFLRQYELRGERIRVDRGASLTINPEAIPLVR